jgi:hypothetical protein
VRSALKTAWFNLAILTTLLVCVEGIAFGYYFVRSTLSGYDRVDAFIKGHVAKMPRDGYPNPADQTWFEAYWKEFNDSTYAAAISTSYSNWHREPFRGKYINVAQNGRRATWAEPSNDASHLVRVAMFGGSTIWGTGARDDFTIPSYVAKILAEKYPHRFTVVNYGQDGYVSTQEVIALLREIQNNQIPDIAVFYDGYNEVYTAYQTGAAGFPMNEDNRMREFNILHPSRTRDFYFEVLSRTSTFQLAQGLRTAMWPKPVQNSSNGQATQALAADVVRTYFRNIEAVTAMEKHFGFAARFFWQPSVYTKSRPTKAEESMIYGTQPVAVLYRPVHEAMKMYRSTAQPDFRDISNVLDGYAGTAFIDAVHVTELANEAIAREIVASLKGTGEQAEADQAHSIE